MKRDTLRHEVTRRLDGRQLVWFGTRGDDIESLSDLEPMAAAFSIIGRYARRSSVEGIAMEDLSGRRVDLDAYDIDEEPDRHAFEEFRRMALRVLATPSAVFTYRPSSLVSSLCFARRDRCVPLGMFKDHQFAFEHKPWVESAVADLGLAHIPWRYVADEEQFESLPLLDEGPVMLRRSRSSGGTGLVRVDDRSQLESAWFDEPDSYVGVAPFIDGGVPVNVGAVVWDDGLTLHPASVQLIGIAGCTRRPFGYCGNDFGAAFDLGADVLEQIEASTRSVGDWLRRNGYRGAFGADFLVHRGQPLFTEVNPRFQGSTHVSCQLSVELDESCLLLEHLAALLRIAAPPSRALADYMRGGDLAHVVIHSVADQPVHVDGAALSVVARRELPIERSDVVVDGSVLTDPGATVVRLTTRQRLTWSGFEVADDWHRFLVGLERAATDQHIVEVAS